MFRDERGAPVLIRARGFGCSHGPDVYVDARGEVAGVIANQPVESELEAGQLRARIDALLEGLHESDRVSCPGEWRPPGSR